MRFQDIKERLSSFGVVMARPKDRWTITGDFRYSDDITFCTYLYYVTDEKAWIRHATRYVSELFSDVEGEGPWEATLKIDSEVLKIRIIVVSSPVSMGFSQLVGALPKERRNDLAILLKQNRSERGVPWPKYGYSIGVNNGLYLSDKKGSPYGSSLVVPHVRFMFLLLKDIPWVIELAKKWRWSV